METCCRGTRLISGSGSYRTGKQDSDGSKLLLSNSRDEKNLFLERLLEKNNLIDNRIEVNSL